MSSTIALSIQLSDAVRKFLQTQGMVFDEGLHGETLYVEVREKPVILVQLEAAGIFELSESTKWDMLSLTSSGVTLYVMHPDAGDGYVFVPSSNIVSVHTISESWTREVKQHRVS
ncbi:hypothetical protein [Paraburkholderia caledonica]|uniref:hypothetical protein n=1 Tax=Paraburkholderia caledonica TaxID=134536 RepID=UPI001177FFAE|nr:hypothetical protein [Paraburkholderia caledonica]